MALESRLMTFNELGQHFRDVNSKKMIIFESENRI
jgi:hypothetical protein